MKNRNSLINLHRFQVEACHREVAGLESLLEEFRQKEKNLEQQVSAEQNRAGISDVAHYAYPMYAKSMRSRRENILQSIEGIDIKLETAREKLAEAFRELKKYELIEENRLRRNREKRNRLEQNTLDEVGLGMYQRTRETRR